MIDVHLASERELVQFARAVDEYQDVTGDFLSMPTGSRYEIALQRIKSIKDTRAEAFRAEQERRELERKAKAEALEEARRQWEQNPLNEATSRGWEAMKKLAPGLDGVKDFSDLPDSLMFRYGEFTRAVLGMAPSGHVVLSQKQLAGLAPKPGDDPDEFRAERFSRCTCAWCGGDD